MYAREDTQEQARLDSQGQLEGPTECPYGEKPRWLLWCRWCRCTWVLYLTWQARPHRIRRGPLFGLGVQCHLRTTVELWTADAKGPLRATLRIRARATKLCAPSGSVSSATTKLSNRHPIVPIGKSLTTRAVWPVHVWSP